MSTEKYESFIRDRITELRMKMNVSEHRMSLELGKSGAYIRNITSGVALPSLRELSASWSIWRSILLSSSSLSKTTAT